VKYVDEFRNRKLAQSFFQKLNRLGISRPVRLMEVCGTHTQSFFRFGLDKLIPRNIRLISGPGCPVCVSTAAYLDQTIALSRQKDIMIATFADMLRVPGSSSALEKERARGAAVAPVYSAYAALEIARRHPRKKVVFLAVGFETTAPTIALTLLAAAKQGLGNLFFLSSLKLIPPAMGHLAQDRRLKLDGFLCPGHVSAIIGSNAYAAVARKYKIPCCVAGFEPLDMLEGIYILLQQVAQGDYAVTNEYRRVVKKEGNPRAQKIISEVFSVTDAPWRSLGLIPQSGLQIRKEFRRFDAEKVFGLRLENWKTRQPDNRRCRCADVLKGLITPGQCPLFARACAPQHPVGPCMVSSEGACSSYYKYRR
jgi:hydrogenase expression/formation protein HypD